MAARPTHDMSVKAGEYQDGTGQTKARWQRIGTVFRHDDGGTSIKLDCLPVGLPNWDGWVAVFKREDKQDGQGSGHQRAPSNARPTAPTSTRNDFDDDIPF